MKAKGPPAGTVIAERTEVDADGRVWTVKVLQPAKRHEVKALLTAEEKRERKAQQDADS